MDDESLQSLYAWIDEIPLSRQKKNISRDFSDVVLVAEVIAHFCPRLVELHNYQPANSVKQKLENWKTLQHKVLRKLDLTIPENVLQGVVHMKPGVIEVVLNNVRLKIQQYLAPPAIDYLDADIEPEPPLNYAPVASPAAAGRRRGAGARDRSGGRSAPGAIGGPDRRWHQDKQQPPAPPQNFRQVQSFAAPGPARITKLPPKRKLGESPRAMQKASHRAYFKEPGGRVGPGRAAGVSGRIPISVASGAGSAAGHPALPRTTPGLKPGGGATDPYAIIDEQEKEILNCQETMAILQIKVKKLEQLVQLKDRKIDELSQMQMHAYDSRLQQQPPRVGNSRR